MTVDRTRPERFEEQVEAEARVIDFGKGRLRFELLMWAGPILLFGLYLGTALLLSRWDGNELSGAFLIAMAAGLFGLTRMPMRFVHKALIACWYVPTIAFLLLAMTYKVGCGTFGDCF